MRWVVLPIVLLSAALVPGLAQAQTYSFLNTEGFIPANQVHGPANVFPATVAISGVGGTVKKVTLTAIDLNANDDLDMALVGPNGAQVMLMSDACGSQTAAGETWTFEDEAPEFVPAGTCPPDTRVPLRPTNYDPESDDFGPGGPTGEFSTKLAQFDGISPNGTWKLFMNDDTEGRVGFELSAFALNFEIEPPAPAPPTIVEVPVPVQVQVPVPVPVPTPTPTSPAPTGKRAAALAKCKTKKAAEARKQCRAKAKKLPV